MYINSDKNIVIVATTNRTIAVGVNASKDLATEGGTWRWHRNFESTLLC